MIDRAYIIITSARNEDDYIEKTIQSVISQTIRPIRWIIVSDGSTDRTEEIVSNYMNDYDFIKLLKLKRDGKRNFGSMADAFNQGYNMINNTDYDYIGNLDADITFDADYYERLLENFQRNRRLGLAGGTLYERQNGKFEIRTFNSSKSVPHAVQLFRRDCYEEVGGFVPLKYGGTDWYVEVMTRMKAWHTETFPEIKALHHRKTFGTTLSGSFRQGLKDYSVGSHPMFELFKCMYRIKGKPYLVGALLRFAGFIWLYIKGEKRMVPDEFVRFLRREQISRLKSLLLNHSNDQ